MPRSGTTLIRTILDQNPDLYCECYSALYQLLRGFDITFKEAYHTLRFSNRLDAQEAIMSQVFSLYYNKARDISVLDNYKMWCSNEGVYLIEKYLSSSPKIIVCLRPMEEIVKSFAYISKLNNHKISVEEMIAPKTDPIMFAYEGITEALRNNNQNNFLYVSYDKLVDNTEKELKNIYDFLDIKYYKHDLKHIIQYNPIDDNYINMIGLHDIRNNISRRKIDLDLTSENKKMCNFLTKSYEKKL